MLAEGPRVPAAVLQIRAGGVPGVWGGYKEAGAAGGAPRARPASAMLSAQERIQVAQVWDLIAGHEASFGAELLLRWVEAGFPGSQGGGHRGLGPESEERPRREISGCLGSAGAGRTPGGRPPHSPTCSVRLFTVYPSTKSYFKHLGFCPDETQLLTHGQRMLEAVGVAVQHMDNLRAALSPLADLHAQVLRVDPSNFPVSPPGPP